MVTLNWISLCPGFRFIFPSISELNLRVLRKFLLTPIYWESWLDVVLLSVSSLFLPCLRAMYSRVGDFSFISCFGVPLNHSNQEDGLFVSSRGSIGIFILSTSSGERLILTSKLFFIISFTVSQGKGFPKRIKLRRIGAAFSQLRYFSCILMTSSGCVTALPAPD